MDYVLLIILLALAVGFVCYLRKNTHTDTSPRSRDEQELQIAAIFQDAHSRTRPSTEQPERRVFDYSHGNPEDFYAKMSRDLVDLHGPLARIEYLEHFPSFRIRFTYKDGTVIHSDERRGQHDIHFLSLGYVGEGPRYAKAFLSAAGIDLSTNEIEKIKPGDVITAESGTEERFAKPGQSRPQSQEAARNAACRFGATEQLSAGILSKSLPVLSPDGSLVAILKTRNSTGATLEMLGTETHSPRWSIQLSSTDCETAFISVDRILVLVGVSGSKSTIQLLDVADGSIIDTADAPALTRSGTDMGWVGGKRVQSDPSRNFAVREFEGDRILRFRIKQDKLNISSTKVSQIYAEGPRIGPDGQCYFISHYSLCRLTDDGLEEVFGQGNHCICSDPQGRIYCGSGYGDMSGESYLHIIDLKTNKARSLLLGREPIHRLHIAGENQVLVSSIVERSQFRNRHHAYVAALNVSGSKGQILWERRIEGIEWGRAPAILTVPDEGWGLLQTGDKLLLIALDTGDVLGETGKQVEEVVLGVWAPTLRRVYLARFPGWEEQGTLESIEIRQK